MYNRSNDAARLGSGKRRHLPKDLMALGFVLGLALTAGRNATKRTPRRYRILLGLAVIAAFLLALPAGAFACVNSCPGGSVAVNSSGFPFCQGGSKNGQLVCTSGSGGSVGSAGLPWIDFTPLEPPHNPFPDVQWMHDQRILQYLEGVEGYNTMRGAPPHGLGGPISFSMYSSDGGSGPYGGANIFSVRNSGYRVSDSAGTFASGSLVPGFTALSGGGGFNFTVDGTPLIGFNGNQNLLLGLNVGYQRTNTNYGTSALTPGVTNAGSEQSDMWTVAGTANYSVNWFYATGMASYNWTHSGITNNLDGGSGTVSGQGYRVGGTAGYVFPLFVTGVAPSAIPTKAPPPVRSSGSGLFLDTSGYLSYQKQWNNQFTDSAGFIYGVDQVSYTDLGGKVRLVAVVPSARFSWMPFVGVSLDRQIGFSHTFDIPTQAASAADTIFFGQSNTYWGAQVGVNLINRAAIQAGVSGFYSASADTSIVGGNAFVRIPFYADAFPAGNSGIRAAPR
jgi:hypothetical protein